MQFDNDRKTDQHQSEQIYLGSSSSFLVRVSSTRSGAGSSKSTGSVPAVNSIRVMHPI